MCVAHFKSKESESKRPRICLEEGRAATRGSVRADETKGRLALPGVKVATGDHVKAVTEMPYPVYEDGKINMTSLRSFIGMCKYLRRYLKVSDRKTSF